MNVMERDQGEAKLHFLDGEYEIVTPGGYVVVCAVTGAHIPLDALRYWSVTCRKPMPAPTWPRRGRRKRASFRNNVRQGFPADAAPVFSWCSLSLVAAPVMAQGEVGGQPTERRCAFSWAPRWSRGSR